MFEQIRRDFNTHGRAYFNPALWAILTYRFGVWSNQRKFPFFRWFTSKIFGLLFFIVLITSGIRLHREVVVGKNFHLIHSGNIQIHPGTIIGDNCGIQQDVTIGTNMDKAGVPVIGDDVFIGKGATVLGPITIGDRVIIAANSLVVKDVPSDSTAIGVPARIIAYGGGNKSQ